MNPDALLPAIIALAKQAGEQILAFYHTDKNKQITTKADQSPVTAADLAAHYIISAGLKKLTPELPVISEESAVISFAQRRQWQRFWLVDPLDGTKEFINNGGDFSVNIALIDQHRPVLGVVYAPALELNYFAAVGAGAYKQIRAETPQAIHTAPWANTAIRVAVSRRHGLVALDKFLQSFAAVTRVAMGSALKCGLIAEGAADIYPRLSPTSEWDTAAGQCVIEQAGGAVLDLTGKPLRYNSKESLENPSFLAVGDPQHDWVQYLT
jgi:3'(2'), 5'-bisphosphate nucleotidase